MYQIAIDPGLTATGFAVFSNGKCLRIGTIWPKGPSQLVKLQFLSDQLRTIFLENYIKLEGKPSEVAVEEWNVHSPQNRFQTMIRCAEARGVIIEVSFQYCDHIRYVGKGTARKQEADWLANRCKLAGSEHARDALHLGVIAGYCSEM